MGMVYTSYKDGDFGFFFDPHLVLWFTRSPGASDKKSLGSDPVTHPVQPLVGYPTPLGDGYSLVCMM